MTNLRDYPTIDIMNNPGEFQGGLGAGMAKFREVQIMMQTTFKNAPPIAPAQPSGGATAKKPAIGAGHPTVEACVADMDELGYAHVSTCAIKMWSYYYHHDFIMDIPIGVVADAVKRSNGRIMGAASYNPFRISDSLREIETAVNDFGFNYVWLHSLGFGVAPNDRRCYPLYAKCQELGIAVGFQVGQSAEVLPSDCGRPMLADEIAIDFPDLRINLSHTGWPWIDEWCSMLWRHPNVYGDIAAYFPKSLDERLIKFMDSSRGRDKVLFGTNGFGLRRCKEEFLQLEIREDTKRKVLYENARRFLLLP